jgi:formate hydrogenlyase subunit 3/multisubunit Na+/H+ antiporter MnhD subunit
MNKHDIAWSNFLIIRQMCIVLLYCNYALISLISNTDLLWQDNILYRIFVYIFLVLTSIAFWRFTHCAAFTGTEEQKEPEEENYKPIARYVVAAAVTLALAIGIFLLAEPILNAVG